LTYFLIATNFRGASVDRFAKIMRPGMDIRRGERGCRFGSPFFQRCCGAPVSKFRTQFLHCFVKKLM